MQIEHTGKPIQINLTRVGELMSEIFPNPTMAGRFKFNLSLQDAVDFLAVAYKREVEYRHRTFILDDNTKKNLTSLAEYMTQPSSKFGIMLCGTCGNGKTTLLFAFQKVVNYLIRHYPNEYKQFRAGMEIFGAREILQIATDYDKFKELKNRPMLAIDDLGAEPLEKRDFGDVKTPIIELIEHRYDKQLFTFITTNLVAKSNNKKVVTIREKYKDRIADRFNEMLHVIVFKDITYRKDETKIL